MNNSINLKWTATGNDAGSGKAYSYDIRYAYEPINSEDVYFTAYRILEFPYPSLELSLSRMGILGLAT